MPNRTRKILIAIAAPLVGMLLGFVLLQFPIVRIPVEPGFRFILPFLRVIEGFLSSVDVPFLLNAITHFTLAIPNILLVAVIVAVAMQALGRPRSVLYSTLAWPALMHIEYWVKLFVLTRGAERLGHPTEIDGLPVDLYFPAKAVGLLLMYTLFLLCVFLTLRVLQFKRNKESRNFDKLPTGDGPAG